MKKASIIIVCGVICLAVGFFIGRSSIKSEPKKEYIKGEALTGSVSPTQFEPIKRKAGYSLSRHREYKVFEHSG